MTQESELFDAYTTVFDGLTHLGPGDAKITKERLDRLRPSLPPNPRVADLGCGTGASTLVLAKNLPGSRILALDANEPFIHRLNTTAAAQGQSDRICAMTGNMATPPDLDGSHGNYDIIWSESAIYSIGRTDAFARWWPLLRLGGWLVFSDIVWQREPAERSNEASTFWLNEYPNIATKKTVIAELRASGYTPLDPILSSRKAWSNYYEPLRQRLRLLAKRQNQSLALVKIMEEFKREIAVYDHVGVEVGLCFFAANRGPVSS